MSNLEGLDKETLTILANLYTKRALCYQNEGKHKQALEDAEYVLANIQSSNKEALQLKANALKNLGRLNDALANFIELL